MTLYNSALAPAIPKFDDGTTVEALAAQDVTSTPTQTTINAAINAVVTQLNELIEHLNNGRTKPF